MAEVAADLEVTSLTQHSLAFERVVGAALDTRAGGLLLHRLGWSM
jgi:hypothetical protein